MKVSALKLRKTPEGRKHLARERQRHWKDILQPGDPRFDKVYGDSNRARVRKREQQEQAAQTHNEEVKEREAWDVKQGFRV